MFGGLDLKGGDDKKDEGSAPPSAPTTSGFSFMTTTAPAAAAAPEPEPSPPTQPPAAPSAFSFMTGAPAAAEPVVKEPKTDPPASGFSFMGSTAPAPPPPPNSSGPPPNSSGPSSSAFGFMSSSPSVPTTTQASPMTMASPKAEPPAPTASGFSFVASSSPAPPIAKKEVPKPPLSGPAGAGITFGGASATTKKNIKRRTRKVGGGRGEPLPPPMSMTPPVPKPVVTPTPPPAAPVPPPASEPSRADVKDAAEQAARRAEEFMMAMQQQSAVSPKAAADPPAAANPGSLKDLTSQNDSSSMRSPSSRFAPPIDVELEQAKKAAEEAQARLARESSGGGILSSGSNHGPRSAFAWFGSGRKWGSGIAGSTNDTTSTASPPAPSTEMSDSNHSANLPHVSSNGSLNMGASALAKAVSPTFSVEPQHQETPAERILREQEEVKRSMAQRHLVMQHQEEKALAETNDADFNPPPGALKLPKFGRAAASGPAPAINSVVTVPQEPRPPPPPKTPKDEMNEIFDRFAREVKSAVDHVDALRQQRNMLLDERFVALAKERLAVQQIAQTESQQMAAAEAEDYELADRLQVILEGHQREKAEVSAILDNISKALSQLDAQSPVVVGAVSSSFRNVEGDLKEFHKKQLSSEKLDGNGAMKRFAATSKQLSAEDERLKAELKHIERDTKLADDERTELDDAISEQTKDMEKERDLAKEKLGFVEGEIDFLRKQLQEKQTEMIRLKNEVVYHETEIKEVRSKFSRQLARVEKKELSVTENRKEWENEKAAYDALKKAHEADVTAHSEAMLANNEMMDTLDKEIELANTFHDIVAKEVVFDDSRNKDSEADGDLAQLQADVVKVEAAMSEAKQVLKAAEAKKSVLETEIGALKLRLPSLEKEKKEAAARRDFKKAGTASKAIKEATARLSTCESELYGEAEVKRGAAQSDLDRLAGELDAKRAIALEKEKESGKEMMEKLAGKIRRLTETKQRVCVDEKGNSIQGMGAYVLKAQIQALVLEGNTYGEKFGGWDELMKDVGDETLTLSNEKESNVAVTPEKSASSSRSKDEVNKNIVTQARQLMERMQTAEKELESAVEEEDYEKADELNKVFESIQVELEQLDLTDAETELIMSNDTDLAEKEPESNAVSQADETERKSENVTAPQHNQDEKEEAENENGEDNHQQASSEKGGDEENAIVIEQNDDGKTTPDEDTNDEPKTNGVHDTKAEQVKLQASADDNGAEGEDLFVAANGDVVGDDDFADARTD